MPAAMPVATPLVLPIVTTDVLLLLHTPPPVALLSVVVEDAHTDVDPLITFTVGVMPTDTTLNTSHAAGIA